MRTKLAMLLAGLASLAAAWPAAAQAVIYVDADAAPGGDGASWASAFRDLQDALAAAEAGDEVWIDRDLAAHNRLGLADPTVLWIRPDARVGGRWDAATVSSMGADIRDVLTGL